MRIYPSLSAFLTLDNSARRAAADVTIDNYSLVPTVNGAPPVITPAINGAIASVAGVSSLGVQADGETEYAETVVVTQDPVVLGTSTLTGLVPSTTVCTFDTAVCAT